MELVYTENKTKNSTRNEKNTSVEFLELIWFLQENNKTFFVFYNKNENYLWALDKFLLQTNKKKIITFAIFTESKSNNMIVNIITWVT